MSRSQPLSIPPPASVHCLLFWKRIRDVCWFIEPLFNSNLSVKCIQNEAVNNIRSWLSKWFWFRKPQVDGNERLMPGKYTQIPSCLPVSDIFEIRWTAGVDVTSLQLVSETRRSWKSTVNTRPSRSSSKDRLQSSTAFNLARLTSNLSQVERRHWDGNSKDSVPQHKVNYRKKSNINMYVYGTVE